MSFTSRILGRLWNLPPVRNHRVIERRAIPIPMRDGVELLTDRFFPKGGDALPVVLVRSPYGRGDLFHLVSTLLAERGLQVLLQSCRGTAGSGGTLRPFFHEEADGCDTIDWLRRQPWFRGKLAAMGTSYLGSAAWAGAHGAGEAISAMVLAMTLSNARAETYAFGGFTLKNCLSWTQTMMYPEGFSTLANIAETTLPQLGRSPKLEEAYGTLPIRDADQVALEQPVSWWRDWLDHSEPGDPYWEPIDYSAVAAKVPPSAMVGGWYDVFLPWLVKDYVVAQAAGRRATLTIGPWKHTSLESVGATVSEALRLFPSELLGEPEVPRAPVRLFVVGADEWREYEQWPPPSMRATSLYLASKGRLVSEPEAFAEPSRFTYDPADPTPSLHGPTLGSEPAVGDMGEMEKRSDVLLFTSGPLDDSIDIVGPVHAELYYRSTCEHTDFFLCLCDVDMNGRSTNVCDGYVRVRPSDGAEPERSAVREVHIEFWPAGYRFQVGHRIRVIVASGAHPRYARNHGTGEPFGDAVAFQVAHQEIFHDDSLPSSIVLPISATVQE